MYDRHMYDADQKTDRFMSQLETAKAVQREASANGWLLGLRTAHNVWAEHSEYYAAEWLSPDSENPAAEIRRAIKTYFARRNLQIPTP